MYRRGFFTSLVSMLSGMAGIAIGWNGGKRISNEESLIVSYGNGFFRAIKKSGEPLMGGVLHIYEESHEAAVNDANDDSVLGPIALNSNGEAEFNLGSTGKYKLTLTDINGNILWEEHNVTEMAQDYWHALSSSSLNEGASLIAHSSVTIESLDELRKIAPRKSSENSTFIVTGHKRGSYRGGGIFYWVSESKEDNGYNIISGQKKGHFIRIYENEINISSVGGEPGENITNALNSLFELFGKQKDLTRTIILGPHQYLVDERLQCLPSCITLKGQWGRTVLKYVGREGNVMLKAASPFFGKPVRGIKIDGITLDLGFTPDVIGLQCIYSTGSSVMGNIRVMNVAADGVGIDITMQWYAFWGNLEIVNSLDGIQGGVGLRLRGDKKLGRNSQVNGIKFPKTQIKNFQNGVLLDTTYAGAYSLDFDVVIEKCVVGIKHQGKFGVGKASFRYHFEGNEHNVIWSTPYNHPRVAGQITWSGYSRSGDFMFSHGYHVVANRVGDKSASVYMIEPARVEWHGTAESVEGNYPGTNIPMIDFENLVMAPGYRQSSQQYALPQGNYGKSGTFVYEYLGHNTLSAINEYILIVNRRARARLDVAVLVDDTDESRLWSGYVEVANGRWRIFKITGNEFDDTFSLRITANGSLLHTGSFAGHASILIIPL